MAGQENIMNKDTILEWLDKATVLELNEVVKAIEEKFGVSAAAVASAGPAAAGAEAAEEKSAYTVVLASAGEQKIAVMKVVKEALGLGLKEAKDLWDTTAEHGVWLTCMSREHARSAKKEFLKIGMQAR